MTGPRVTARPLRPMPRAALCSMDWMPPTPARLALLRRALARPAATWVFLTDRFRGGASTKCRYIAVRNNGGPMVVGRCGDKNPTADSDYPALKTQLVQFSIQRGLELLQIGRRWPIPLLLRHQADVPHLIDIPFGLVPITETDFATNDGPGPRELIHSH